jgi:hypothetical protein
MKSYKLVVAVASTIAVAMIICIIKKNKIEKKLTIISDAGYETAHDILFPLKDLRYRKA